MAVLGYAQVSWLLGGFETAGEGDFETVGGKASLPHHATHAIRVFLCAASSALTGGRVGVGREAGGDRRPVGAAGADGSAARDCTRK